jgi:hypothetical protein
MAWSPLQELVTLDQAKQHLKLPLDLDTEDEDLALKLFVAHENVMDYLSQRVSDQDTWQETVDAWTADTAPQRVLAAILAEFAFLYRFRGDDDKAPPMPDGDVVCPAAKRLLLRYRDPALA